jgi:hypothetical protein
MDMNADDGDRSSRINRLVKDFTNVNVTVEYFEQQIREYNNFEAKAVEEFGDEVSKLLPQLHQFPLQFASCNNPILQELAIKRARLVELEQKLKQQLMALQEDETATDATDTVTVDGDDDAASIISPMQNDDNLGALNRDCLGRMPHPRLADRLSTQWASRLASIDPTQGQLRPVVKIDGTTSLTIRPKWPEWLVDEAFDVLKINKYGKHYHRVLKLTEYHILGIRGTMDITKIYTYKDVEKVTCSDSAHSDSIQSFVVIRFSDGKVFHYVTPMASYIAQQISTRVQVCLALESRDYTVAVNSPRSNDDEVVNRASTNSASGNERNMYSVEALKTMIAAISEDNTKSNASNIVGFAASLRDRIIATTSPRPAEKNLINETLSISSTSEPAQCATSVSVEVQSSRRKSVEAAQRRQKHVASLARRLLVIEPWSPEGLLQDEIRRILFDSTVEEGSTRAFFIDMCQSKSSIKKEIGLVDIRQWIEGMHEYIIKKRGTELCALLVKAQANPQISPGDRFSTTTKFVTLAGANVSSAEVSNRQSHNFTEERTTPQFSTLRQALLENGQRSPPLTENFGVVPFTSVQSNCRFSEVEAEVDGGADTLLIVCYIAFLAVEESVYLPLKSRIGTLLAAAVPMVGSNYLLLRRLLK